MARKKVETRSRLAWELAERQHGVVARRQLLERGFTKSAIEHRLKKGRLHQISKGIYLIGWANLTRERRWMAAVLACGDGAMLSHRSAAELWGFGKEKRGVIDVSIRRHCKVCRAGIHVRDRPGLRNRDVEIA